MLGFRCQRLRPKRQTGVRRLVGGIILGAESLGAVVSLPEVLVLATMIGVGTEDWPLAMRIIGVVSEDWSLAMRTGVGDVVGR